MKYRGKRRTTILLAIATPLISCYLILHKLHDNLTNAVIKIGYGSDEYKLDDPEIYPIRCQCKYLGCFVPDPSKITSYRQLELGNAMGNDFKMECLDACYSSGGLYAGLSKERCLCGEKPEGLVSLEAWDLASACDSLESHDIYMKVRNCEKEMKSSAMEKDLLGCIDSKPLLKGAMVAVNVSAPALHVAQRCILSCERRGFTIAVTSQDRQFCICSDFISL